MNRVNLNPSWAVQTSAKVNGDGAALTTTSVAIDDWYHTDLPATVLGTLVEAGEYPDPFFGDNLTSIPGQGPRAENFSNHAMPQDSPFSTSWWFCKRFTVPRDAGPYLSLQFDGINYRANIWLNGVRIADTSEVVGAYREFELDISAVVDRDNPNALAVEVFPPNQGDIAITWVDWNPSPPDKNMGLWRDVWLKSNGPVKIRAPYVNSKVDGQQRARLTVGCDVINASETSQEVRVTVELAEHRIQSQLELAPRERRRFEEAIDLAAPRLWWPRVMGDPALYQTTIRAHAVAGISDTARFDVGIREVSCDLTRDGHALFRVNGEPVLIRGAGWATDLFLRRQSARDLAQLEYVKGMNLNTIRFEGMLERASFLERCDRDGILVIAGWSCCDSWEKWDEWSDEHLAIAKASLRDQLRRSRRHPCLIAWWYGSDFSPPRHVEQGYLDVLREESWPNAFHSSAADKPTDLTGMSGLKMEGPYDYVPPNYWLEDTRRGGAFGFATEVCPGPAVPPLDSLKKMIPEQHLWPIDEMWHFHAGGQEFHNIDCFRDALIHRYGECSGVEEFAELSQLMTYEAQRAMFEAYARNKFCATGVVQWMLNNSWPSLIWHLFDYYLRPGGGYYGTKLACEPLHVMFAPDDRTVVVTNDYPMRWDGLCATVEVFGLNSARLLSQTETVGVEALGRSKVMDLPYLDGISPIYFIDLKLQSRDGVFVSRNFYWVPAQPDELDHDRGSWINTPIKAYADLKGLRELPPAVLITEASVTHNPGTTTVEVILDNPHNHIAFFTELRLLNSRDEEVLPINWCDNYISLLPGEQRILRATANSVPKTTALFLRVSGINVPSQMLALRTGEEPADDHSTEPHPQI